MLKQYYSNSVKNIYLQTAGSRKLTKKIFKVIFLEIIILTVIISAFINFRIYGDPAYRNISREETRELYSDCLSDINLIKSRLGSNHQNQTDIADVKKIILDIIYNRLIPQWYGTPWDFHGTAEYPNSGSIACGYFVTTILIAALNYYG